MSVEGYYCEVKIAAPKLRTMILGEGAVRLHGAGASCEGQRDALGRVCDLDAHDAGDASEQIRDGSGRLKGTKASLFRQDSNVERLA